MFHLGNPSYWGKWRIFLWGGVCQSKWIFVHNTLQSWHFRGGGFGIGGVEEEKDSFGLLFIGIGAENKHLWPRPSTRRGQGRGRQGSSHKHQLVISHWFNGWYFCKKGAFSQYEFEEIIWLIFYQKSRLEIEGGNVRSVWIEKNMRFRIAELRGIFVSPDWQEVRVFGGEYRTRRQACGPAPGAPADGGTFEAQGVLSWDRWN